MFLSVDCNDWKISSLNLFRIIAPEKDKRKKANKKQKKPNMPRTTALMNCLFSRTTIRKALQGFLRMQFLSVDCNHGLWTSNEGIIQRYLKNWDFWGSLKFSSLVAKSEISAKFSASLLIFWHLCKLILSPRWYRNGTCKG